MKWYKVPGVEDTGQPFIKKVKAGSKTICLVSCNGELLAFSAYCPHAGGDLTQGWCSKGKLVCPIHRYSYDLHTGKGSEGQNDFIYIYPVKVKEDGIYIGITSFWDKILGQR